MRYTLLCCSDTHGKAPPAFEDSTAAAWLHTGDVYNGPEVTHDGKAPLRGDPIAEVILSWSRERRAPDYAVHGNHDVADPYCWFAAMTELDGRVERLGSDLLVVGIGWHGEMYAEPPLEADLEAVCERVQRQLRRLAMSKDRIVLLCHYPPRIDGLFPPKRGVIGEPGYEALARLVQELRPLLIVQGHEHSWFGLVNTIFIGERATLVVNPGPAGMRVIVDTDRESAELD